MTKITIFRNQDQAFLGFDCLGHAGYAEEGEDIVCAGMKNFLQILMKRPE